MFSHREVADFYWTKMTVNTTKDGKYDKFFFNIYLIFSQKSFRHQEVADFYWAKMTANAKEIFLIEKKKAPFFQLEKGAVFFQYICKLSNM